MAELLFTLGGFAALGALCWACYHAGKTDGKVKDLNDTLEKADAAAVARDRLRHDAAYAKLVRDRFTR